jgi:outer membrane protein TolC
MVRFPVLVAAVWTMLLPAAASAQEALALRDAIRAALDANPRLRAAQAETDRADALRTEARAAFFPQVSFSESWQRSNQPVFAFSALLAARQFTAADFAVDRLNAPGSVDVFASRLFLRQVLFDGQVQARSAQAAHQHDAAQAALEAARADLVLQVTDVYGRLLGAEAMARAADAAAAAAHESLARAERRRDAGTVTDADVLALQVHLSAMRQRTIRFEGDAAIARAELNGLMNAPVTGPLTSAEPALPETGALDIDTLLRDAEAARPEIRRAEAERDAAAASARAARAGWLPRISAQAGFQLDGLSFGERADAWIVGGELTWQLSVGGAEQARMRAAGAAVRSAGAGVETARTTVHVDVVTAVRRLEAARSRADAGRATVDHAAERERIVRNRYDAGLAGIVDVLDAATARLDAEAERVAALTATLVAQAMLDRAVGRPFNPSQP